LGDSRFSIGYGKFNKVSGIEVNVYGQTGEKIKKIKTDEILDVSDIDEGTVYSDYRRKAINPKYQTYPFTVEYVFTITYNSSFFLPSWTVFKGYNTSVEKSTFSITVPAGYNLRYKENKIKQEAPKSTASGKETYMWSVSNFKARNPEPFSPDEDELFPGVIVAPSSFEIENYKGNMETWKDLGQGQKGYSCSDRICSCCGGFLSICMLYLHSKKENDCQKKVYFLHILLGEFEFVNIRLLVMSCIII
jgi:hypothetical protein